MDLSGQTHFPVSKVQLFTMKHRSTPLLFVLVAPFVLQLAGAVGIVGFFSFQTGRAAVDDLASQLRSEVTNRIQQKLTNYLNSPALVNQLNAEAFTLGEVDSAAPDSVLQHFHRKIQLFPAANYISFGSATGDYLSIDRLEENNTLRVVVANANTGGDMHIYATDTAGNPTQRVEVIPNYDPRIRPWYRVAANSRAAAWSEVHTYFTDSMLAINYSQPLYQDGNLLGVLTNNLGLAEVGDFLREIKISDRGQTFILERSGQVIASSSLPKPFRVVNGEVKRVSAADSDDSLLGATFAQLQHEFGNLNGIRTAHQLNFTAAGQRQFVQVTPLVSYPELDWLIVVTIPEADFMAQIYANTRNTIWLTVAALGIAIGLGVLTAHWLTRPMLKVIAASEEMAQGDLDQQVDQSSRITELETLAHSFNSMAGQLKESFETLEDKVEERTAELASANEQITALNEKLKAENLRMSAELDVARQIQDMILPTIAELENVEGLEIVGYMDAADEVGGDYYDVLQTNGVVTIGIGDVTGHGLESGLLMLMTQTAVRTLQELREYDSVRFLDTLNRTIYHNVERMNSDKNLTLTILNYSEGRVSISGQHEETLIVRADSTVERIDTIDLGMPIGLDDNITEFINHTIVELQPGDGVVLYTDGIPEAYNIHEKQYGMARLCEVISQSWSKSAEEIKQAIIDDVHHFIGKQKVFDDITLLVIKQR